jgi:DNA-binding NtrC family response regulator
MPTLHLYCDLREPSLSRAAREARRLESYAMRVDQVRTGFLAESLSRLAAAMGDDDLGLVALLHASDDQLQEAAHILSRQPLDLRRRITFCCSGYSQGMQEWAERCGLKYERNRFETPRRAPWTPPYSTYGVTLAERYWIQYRLMRALIAGEPPAAVYEEIILTLRQGAPAEAQFKRAQRFVEQGEPDMAGGNYAEERRLHPNAIDRLRDRAVQVGRSGLNTLIIGETGTGKESLAWYLHDFSTRCDQPFLALNCAFFEGERLESELFGHEQGAFTDAKKAKKGLVEEADGGTLFLDELPEMAPRVQAKLLRFLQDGSYTRMGGNRVFRASVRIISAAQPGLLDKLRPDLYYRVADVELRTVPLREMKPRDILNIGCNLGYRLMWRPVIGEDGESVLTPEAIRAIWQQLALPEHVACLAAYRWPGNMRELSTLIKRFVLLGDDIFGELQEKPATAGEPGREEVTAFDEEWGRFLLPVTSLAEVETRRLRLKNLPGAYVRHLVASLGGRTAIQPTKLAEALGCTYNTLMGCLAPPSTSRRKPSSD